MGAEYPVPKLPASPHQRLDHLATSVSIAIAGVLFAEIVALDRLNIQLGYLRVVQNPPTDGFPITGPYGFWANSTPLERAWPYPVLAVAFTLAAAVWLVWQYQAHENRRALRLSDDRFTPLAGVGSWFVPLANLVLPALAIGELWGTPHGDTLGIQDRPRHRGNPVLWIWWTGILVSATLAGIAYVSAAIGGHSIEALARRNILLMWALVVSIVSGVLAAVMVHRISWRVLIKQDQVRFPPRWTAWGTPSERSGVDS